MSFQCSVRSLSSAACAAAEPGSAPYLSNPCLHVGLRPTCRHGFDKYGADPGSAAAQAALDKLRTEHWNDMRELLKRYSADPATTPQGGAAGGYGAGMMGGGSG